MDIKLPHDLLVYLESGPKTREEILEELIYGHLHDVPGDWLRTAWHRVCVSFASLSRYKTRCINRHLDSFVKNHFVSIREDDEYYAKDRYKLEVTGRFYLYELRQMTAPQTA